MYVVRKSRKEGKKAADSLCEFHGLKAVTNKRVTAHWSPRSGISLPKAVYTTLWLVKIPMACGVRDTVKRLREHVERGLTRVYPRDVAKAYSTYLRVFRLGDDVLAECTRVGLTEQFGPTFARDELASSNPNEATIKRSQEVGQFKTHHDPSRWCAAFTGVSIAAVSRFAVLRAS
jgi:hypothetical protein